MQGLSSFARLGPAVTLESWTAVTADKKMQSTVEEEAAREASGKRQKILQAILCSETGMMRICLQMNSLT